MFLEFYGLREQPFGVTPNPRFLFAGPSHREVLASLLYAVQSDLGFSALIADPGMGKTTLLFDLLERFRNSANTAFLFNTQCNSQDLLRYVLTELGVETDGHDAFFMHEKFKEVLLQSAREGKKVLLVLDEAHNLDDSVLETVRLLSNFETSDSKLLHIILAGQTQLAEKLMRPGMMQLCQRISIVNRLKPFTPKETCAYIEHRLQVAGYNQGRLFTPDAVARIADYSGGVPRTINRLCFGGLSIGCALNQRLIAGNVIDEVSQDLNLLSLLPSPRDSEKMPAKSFAEQRNTALPYMEKRSPLPNYVAEASTPLATAEERSATAAMPTEAQRAIGAAALGAHVKRAAISPAPDQLLHRFPGVLQSVRRLSSPQFAAASVALCFVLVLAALLLLRLPELRSILYAQSSDAHEVQAAPAAGTATPPSVQNEKSSQPTPGKISKSQRPHAAAPADDTGGAVPLSGFVEGLQPLNPDGSIPNSTLSPLASASRTARASPPVAAEDPAPPPAPLAASTNSSQPPTSSNILGNVLPTTPRVAASAPAAAAPAPPLAISEGVVPGKLLEHPQPVYPDEAKRLGIQGKVQLRAVIGKDGKVKDVRPIEGNPRLAAAASDAVRRWKYEPYALNGEPIEVDTQITINFNLAPR